MRLSLRPSTCLLIYFHLIGLHLLYTFLVNFLFVVLRYFQHCTGHIMTGSFMGRVNQYTQLVKALYCRLLTIGKQLPTLPHEVRG